MLFQINSLLGDCHISFVNNGKVARRWLLDVCRFDFSLRWRAWRSGLDMYSTAGMHDKRCKYPCTFSSRNIASSFELFKVWELEGNEKRLPTLSCLLFPLVLYFWMFRSHLNHMDWAVTSNSLRSTTFIRNWFGWTVHLTTLTACLLMGWGAPRVAPPAAAVRAASRYPDRGRKDRWVWRLLRVPRGRPFPSSPLLASW